MCESTILLMKVEADKALNRLIIHLEAGMTPSVAFEIALRDHESAYRICCGMAEVPASNCNLDPVTVEMQARFALDCLFGALKGKMDESQCRAAFWSSFRRAIRPTLTPRLNPKPC